MMKVLLDSCMWGGAKKDLDAAGFDVVWVGDFLKDPGDEAIMQFSCEHSRVIVTQDKDFGELAIFRGIPHFGIIRLVNFPAAQHGSTSIRILNLYKQEVIQKAIITVDNNKVRVRLP
jgi:predicted nuclease of predicted toxin-antitoxin system